MKRALFDRAFAPYEKQLRAQERRRRRLGVREVERPTYERYISGPIERFDRRKNAFMALDADNPYETGMRQRFKARTGLDHWRPSPPYSELAPENRIGQSLAAAAFRFCSTYEPQTVPITPPDGRLPGTDPASLSRLIKQAGLYLGAAMVRIAELDPRWVYQDIDIPQKYAIVVVVPHVRSLNNTAPSYYSWLSVADTYARLKFVTTQLADFIAGLGYEAAYRETLGHNPELLMVPIALDAGVGEFARNGRVLSPEYGVNMRLKAVTTDLPLQPDKPISFGVHRFCLACENCAIYCPPQAIPYGPPDGRPVAIHNNPGYNKWYVDAEKCLTFWAVDRKRWYSCGGRCIAVCPWNQELTTGHDLARWLAIHSPAPILKLLAQAHRRLYRHTRRLT